MEKLRIASVAASEILSREELKRVFGGAGSALGATCITTESCNSNEKCVRGYCVNYLQLPIDEQV